MQVDSQSGWCVALAEKLLLSLFYFLWTKTAKVIKVNVTILCVKKQNSRYVLFLSYILLKCQVKKGVCAPFYNLRVREVTWIKDKCHKYTERQFMLSLCDICGACVYTGKLKEWSLVLYGTSVHPYSSLRNDKPRSTDTLTLTPTEEEFTEEYNGR